MNQDMMQRLGRKWYIILLGGIIGAALVYMMMVKGHPTSPMVTRQVYTRVIRFEQIPTAAVGDTMQEIHLEGPAGMWSMRQKLLDDLVKNVDISGLNFDANSKGAEQKYTWLGQHFMINYTAPGTYELVLLFSNTDVKGMEYLNKNHQYLMDAWARNVELVADTVARGERFNTVEDFSVTDELVVPMEGVGQSAGKVIMGFLAGAFLNAAVLMVLLRRQQKADLV